MVKKSILVKRASDSPSRLAALFALLYIVFAPWYALTRREWSVLLKSSLALCGQVLLSEVAILSIENIWGVSLEENPLYMALDFSVAIIVLAVSSYFSIKKVVLSARVQLSSEASGVSALDTLPSRSVASRVGGISRVLKNKIPKKYLKKRVVIAIPLLLVILLCTAYGIYTLAVENTVKSNPILVAASNTGTTVRIRHFNCGDIYGKYDSYADRIDICLAAHGSDFSSSKETTIRHEAWHLVQACSTVNSKDDEWGEFGLVNLPALANKTLPEEDIAFIDEYYDPADRSIEREAFLAERFLTDAKIIESIDKHCYLPD